MPATELFQKSNLKTPNTYRKCLELIAHDTNEVVSVTSGIMVNVSGLVKVVFEGDANGVGVILQMNQGVIYPWRIQQVFITGTAAGVITGKIFGFY